MNDHQIPHHLTWPNCLLEGEQIAETQTDQLKQALLRTTLELQSTRVLAQQQIKNMETQTHHLTQLLDVATKERDVARHQCHSLLGHLLRPNECSNTPIPSVSSSEGEEEEHTSNVSLAAVEMAAREKGLPEKGRLVEAVMKAGPLLQSLLLAGPLPQWQHPPPALRSFEIPAVCVGFSGEKNEKVVKKKRGRQQSPGLSSSPESNGSSKYQQLGCFGV